MMHNEVAGVGVGGVLGLVLATENHGSLGREATERHAVGVDEHPLALDFARLGELSRLLHLTPPTHILNGCPWTRPPCFFETEVTGLWVEKP
jgi:hypothetical protein